LICCLLLSIVVVVVAAAAFERCRANQGSSSDDEWVTKNAKRKYNFGFVSDGRAELLRVRTKEGHLQRCWLITEGML